MIAATWISRWDGESITLLDSTASFRGGMVILHPGECCATAAATVGDAVIAVYRDRSDTEIRDISIVRHEPGQDWTSPETCHADLWKIPG